MASCSPPSRTLRAAQARSPSAILDRGCARRLGMVRPGRRNGPFQPNQETSQVGRAVPHGKGSAVASTHAKRRGGKRIRPLVEITSTIGQDWMSICLNRSKQRWRGPSRASADVFSAVLVLFEDAADFAELGAEAGAQAGQNRDERDCDQRSDQRVFDSGGARLVADERLEGLDHFLLLLQSGHPYGPVLSSVWNGDRLPAPPFPRS